MAGRGPQPKAPDQRTRNGSGINNLAFRTIELPTADKLPPIPPDDLLPPGDKDWHSATLRWWRTWRESPLTQGLPASDLAEFEMCAVLHHQFMTTRKRETAAELRQRMSAFGATPADRMRLRILTADADTKDDKKPQRRTGAAEKYGDLRLVDPARKSG